MKRTVALPLAIAVVAALATCTWQVSHRFVSESVLFHSVLQDDPANWEANARCGLEQLDAQHFDEAEPYFLQAAKTYPEGGEIWVGLGQIAEHRKQYDKALEDYRVAVERRPMAPLTHFYYANVLLIKRQASQAIDEYRVALELDAGLVAAHENLGIALLKLNDTDGARLEFQAALAIDPGSRVARKYLSMPASQPAGVAPPNNR